MIYKIKNYFRFFLSVISAHAIVCPASATEFAEKIPLKVHVAKNISLAVDLYVPKNVSKPKALIIISPGTGGVAEIALEAELKQAKYDPDNQSGVVKLFSEAGYATAFFWQRGIKRAGECAGDAPLESRFTAYIKNCYDQNIRKNVDLEVIASDTEKVYQKFAALNLTKTLPVITLGFSEGSYHTAKLVGKKKIEPIGIVYVGGMRDSLAETIEYQMRNDFYFRKIELTFAALQKDKVTFAEVVREGRFNFVLGFPNRSPWGIGNAMGDVVITKDQVLIRKMMFEKNLNDLKTAAATIVTPVPITGAAFGLALPNLFSSAYYTQIFEDRKKVIEYLHGFKGEIRFLYGEHESLVDIPLNNFCGQVGQNCNVEKIPNVGHTLEDESGFLPKKSLDAILKAVHEVSNR